MSEIEETPKAKPVMEFVNSEHRVFMREINKKNHGFGEWNEESNQSVDFFINDFMLDGKTMPANIMTDMPNSCDYCNAYLVFERSDDPAYKFTVKNDECSFPDGKVTEAFVNFPSGKIIVHNDLRPIFKVESRVGYNSLLGQAKYVEDMAAIGCAYGPVNNTSPNVYLTAEGKLVVANFYNEDGENYSTVLPEGWVEVAGIVTDLWAYCIADYDLWLERGGEPVKETPDFGDRIVIDVVPGLYKLTHFTTRADFDWDADEQIYGTLERVSEPPEAN